MSPPLRRVVQQGLVLGLGSREGVVHGVVALRLVVPLQQGEVDDPQGGELLRVAQTQLRAHLQAQGAELHPRLHGGAAENQHQVAGLGAHLVGNGLQGLGIVELVHRALERAVGVVFDIHHAAGTHLRTLDEVGQRVELLARIFGAAFSHDAHHQLGVVEEAEAVAFDHIGHLLELHAEAQVGLVAAVEAHGVVPGHAGELAELDALHLLEEVLGQALEHVEHILLVHERHLAVDLRELRLAVGAQVLVAEAAHNLEVAVHAGHHQQLLVLLRALRQGVELAGIHTAGHHKVAGTLGRALDEHGGLNLQEVSIREVVSHQHGHAVAHLEVLAHRVAADVEVAVFHAQVVAAVALVLDGEGGRLGLVEDIQLRDLNLDLSRGNLRVLASCAR